MLEILPIFLLKISQNFHLLFSLEDTLSLELYATLSSLVLLLANQAEI